MNDRLLALPNTFRRAAVVRYFAGPVLALGPNVFPAPEWASLVYSQEKSAKTNWQEGASMDTSLRWRSADLDRFPDPIDGTRFEIIDGELLVAKQPGWDHQLVALAIGGILQDWCRKTEAGIANAAPGVIFAEDEDVAPDVVWVSSQRLARALATDRKLHEAPDLVVEVLSPGTANERRDRDAKLQLYTRRGVREYWIVDVAKREIDVYRRATEALQLVVTLRRGDLVESSLLPGFVATVDDFFWGVA
jgi:Uma2 family endonuclease